MNTNPILGFLKTLLLFAGLRVIFLKEDKNKQIIMEDRMKVRVFRHVKIRARQLVEPEAVFIVRFRPQKYDSEREHSLFYYPNDDFYRVS